MNQIINISDELAKLDYRTYVVSVVILLVVCLLYCFYGYGCIRFISALIGFGIGLWAGSRLTELLGLASPLNMIIPFVIGVALALISYGVYRLAVFLTVFTAAFGTVSQLVVTYGADRMSALMQLIVAFAAALLFAVLAEIFLRPLIIVVTALTGGLAFSSILFSEMIQVTWSGQAAFYVQLIVAVVLAVLGMLRQFKR